MKASIFLKAIILTLLFTGPFSYNPELSGQEDPYYYFWENVNAQGEKTGSKMMTEVNWERGGDHNYMTIYFLDDECIPGRSELYSWLYQEESGLRGTALYKRSLRWNGRYWDIPGVLPGTALWPADLDLKQVDVIVYMTRASVRTEVIYITDPDSYNYDDIKYDTQTGEPILPASVKSMDVRKYIDSICKPKTGSGSTTRG